MAKNNKYYYLHGWGHKAMNLGNFVFFFTTLLCIVLLGVGGNLLLEQYKDVSEFQSTALMSGALAISYSVVWFVLSVFLNVELKAPPREKPLIAKIITLYQSDTVILYVFTWVSFYTFYSTMTIVLK